jgi:diguanylate cyclase (GGDEF)-like protein/PAS domain S-box-containing protein
MWKQGMSRFSIYHGFDWLRLAGLTLAYALLARLVLTFSTANGNVTIFWIPGGLALAALLVWGRRYWPAVFAGALAAGLMVDDPPLTSSFLALGNTLESLAAVWLLQRCFPFNPELENPRDFLWLSLAGALASSISALIGPVALWFAGYLTEATVAKNILHWWQADMLGIVLGAPLLLVWRRQPPLEWLAGNRILETLLFFSLAFLVGQIVFLDWLHDLLGLIAQGYWMLLMVVVAALRFGPHGVLLVTSMAAVQGLLGAIRGTGIFANDLSRTGLQNFWSSLLVLTVTGLALSLTLRASRQAFSALQDSEIRFRNLASIAPVVIYQTDSQGQCIFVNKTWETVTGCPVEDALCNGWNAYLHPEDRERVYREWYAAFGSKQDFYSEYRVLAANGAVKEVIGRATANYCPNGELLGFVGTLFDITEKKASGELLWRQANFDMLTGLPNRRMFHDLLARDIKKSHRVGLPLALLLLDLDHFKEVNDTLGHEMGDELLKEAALRLTSCVRDTDTVARLGGDEFTIILAELESTETLDRVAHALLDSLAQPYRLGAETAYVSVSIGITLYPKDTCDLQTLIKNADQAMYAAKSQGRNRYSYFTLSMQEAAEYRLRLTNDIRNALLHGQFEVHYQPIVELATGAVHKAEALIRWKHPERGSISPAEFIPLAEDSGLIHDIGDWVFREAVGEVKRLREHGHPHFQISVNKSPVQFRPPSPSLQGWAEYLRAQGLPGDSIVVEITEGLLMDIHKNALLKLLGFRDVGIQVAIDDFGTGYSALSYLKKFDIDYLKIDQSFTRNLSPESSDLALCEAIVVMAHRLGLKVIAEGVEEQEQLDLLTLIGCDYGQGYWFARPMAADKLEQWLAAFQQGQ